MNADEKDYLSDCIHHKVGRYRKEISKLRSKHEAARAMAMQVMFCWFDSDNVCDCKSCEAIRTIVFKEISIIRSRKSAKIN